MGKIFQFGERVKNFEVPVFNEREIRAAAGILFLFAIISFMYVVLKGDFFPIKLFIVAFLIDFLIRLFINPKFSPSMIVGRLFVRNQEIEYVGAPQKRFAWVIGLVLVLYMFIALVIFSTVGPINLLVCFFCLTFLFSESVLGICLGCKVYPLFNKNKPMLCPGGVCTPKKKKTIQLVSTIQVIIVVLFLILLTVVGTSGVLSVSNIRAYGATKLTSSTDAVFESTLDNSSSSCIVPQWAIDIGHEKLYKEHHGCILN